MASSRAGTGWSSGPLLGFDTETTGVSPAVDRIVSAALVQREGGRTRTTTWLVDPGVEIPATASAVHGISTEMARTSGRPAAEAVAEIARRVVHGLRRGMPLVAFNAGFDLAVLDAELVRHRQPTLAVQLQRAPAPVLDPLALDRALDPDREGPRRLADLCLLYGIDPDAALHAADVDAHATLDLLVALGRTNRALADMAAEEVHVWQLTAARARRQRRSTQRPVGFDGATSHAGREGHRASAPPGSRLSSAQDRE